MAGLQRNQLKTLSADELSVFRPSLIKAFERDVISGLAPNSLDALSKRQVKAFSSKQITGLSKKQIRMADDFIDALSNKQERALPFSTSRRSQRMVDSLNQFEDLEIIPGVDPLA